MQKIEPAKLHPAAKALIDPTSMVILLEIFSEHLRREATLHLGLAVTSRLAAADRLLAQIGREDFDIPRLEQLKILQHHGERIWLLSACRSGGPNPQPPAAASRFHQLRQHRIAEGRKVSGITEKAGVARGQRLDQSQLELLVAPAQFLDEASPVRKTLTLGERLKPAPHKLPLFIGKRQP